MVAEVNIRLSMWNSQIVGDSKIAQHRIKDNKWWNRRKCSALWTILKKKWLQSVSRTTISIASSTITYSKWSNKHVDLTMKDRKWSTSSTKSRDTTRMRGRVSIKSLKIWRSITRVKSWVWIFFKVVEEVTRFLIETPQRPFKILENLHIQQANIRIGSMVQGAAILDSNVYLVIIITLKLRNLLLIAGVYRWDKVHLKGNPMTITMMLVVSLYKTHCNRESAITTLTDNVTMQIIVHQCVSSLLLSQWILYNSRM